MSTGRVLAPGSPMREAETSDPAAGHVVLHAEHTFLKRGNLAPKRTPLAGAPSTACPVERDSLPGFTGARGLA